MKTLVLSVPTFGFVVATRAALAFGVGLLVSERIPEPRRRAIGLMLVAVGAATTIPAARSVLGSVRGTTHGRERIAQSGSSTGQDEKLIGTERFPRKGDDDE